MKNETLKRSWTFILVLMMLVLAAGSFCHALVIINRESNRRVSFEGFPGISAGIVQSGSMAPILEKGDLVFIRKEATYETGDIVLVQDEKGRKVLHRLVINNTYANIILTKGDANDNFDRPLTCEAIQGKLLGSIPKIGIILSIFKNQGVRVFLLALALLFISAGILGASKKAPYMKQSKVREDHSDSSGILAGLKPGMIILTILLIAFLLLIPKFAQIGAFYRTSLIADFSMQASPSEAAESHFGIDEIDIWLD